MLIHGGFWRARYGRKLMEPLCADLAARGWAAWNIEYRRLGNGGGCPRTLDDVAAAIDHLAGAAHGLATRSCARRRDRALRRRPPRGLGGDARGRRACRVTGVVVAGRRAGPAAGVGAAALRRRRHELLGGTPAQQPERYALASPIERLPLGVPALLAHGGRDDDRAARDQRALRGRGARGGDASSSS